MEQQAYERLVHQLGAELPSVSVKHRVDRLARLLETLCRREKLGAYSSLKAVLVLCFGEARGIKADWLLSKIGEELPEQELAQVRQSYSACKERDESTVAPEYSVLSDVLLLDEMGTSKIGSPERT